ncbi:MAG: putative toxin-antitoxin system toxin component, PIN family [Coriobacteriia bacterium]
MLAVLDACVLYPQSLRDLLLRLAEVGLYQVLWTDKILAEMAGAILRNRQDLDQVKMDRLVAAMKDAFPEAFIVGWEPLELSMLNHEKDRHVLAAAVRSRADVIVTSNIKGFGAKACDPYGIEVSTPDEFVCQLLDGDLKWAVSIVDSMAADTANPALTREQVLESLSVTVPSFVSMVRQHVGSP